MSAPVAYCLNCSEPITGDVAEFEGLPGRCFCMGCIDELGTVITTSDNRQDVNIVPETSYQTLEMMGGI